VKDIRIFAGGAKKADWDIGMAIDAIAMANKLDTVILATGDGDFVPVVEYLKYTEGCQVEVIAFGKSSSGQLREAADDFIDMCENPQAFLLGFRGGGARFGIPSLGGKKSGAPRPEEGEVPEDTDGDIDPAIEMSGEPEK
jgi:hypothetical protein